MFILAASQSDTDNTSVSPASAFDKNALLLHCCCVIVQITPVAPGRSSYGASTASVKDAGRKPVCICNTNQCHLDALKSDSSTLHQPNSYLQRKQQHGSLDRLLPQAQDLSSANDKAAKTVAPTATVEQNYRLEKFYHQINGDLFEITRKVPIQAANDKTGFNAKQVVPVTSDGLFDQTKSRHSHLHQHQQSVPPPPQQQQPHHHHHHQQTQQQQQQQPRPTSRGLTKQQSQPQLQLRKNDSIELRVPEKPKPPPRTSSRPKSSETDYVNAPKRLSETLLVDTTIGDPVECFNRSQWQRHSSRSTFSGQHDRDAGEGELSSIERHHAMHQRHSSGPSELSILKSDISDLLLNFPKKQNVDEKSKEIHLSQALRDELLQILKRPLQRQHSGQSDLSSLKNDIVDWLKSQQTRNAPTRPEKPQPKEDEYAVPIPMAARKRHSFGHPEKASNDVPDWIQYPINRISEAGRARLGLDPITVDATENRRERTSRMTERKLRHSASEVVTPITEPSSASKHRMKYERASGSCSKDDCGRERSRRGQTQRSATISDMSIGSVRRQQRKKSLSAERDSPHTVVKCTDPMCPLIPICTDPNCCFNDCCNSKRFSSLPRCTETKCAPDCNYQEKPADAKCYCQTCYSNVKHNSLPKCMNSHRSNRSHFTESSLPRGDSHSSLPRTTTTNGHHSHRSRHHNGKGKLVKSVSAASLNSRRRRHKTVHFGENLLREVCQNRKLIEPLQKTPSTTEKSSMQSNIQMLYNFVEGVLSAWVDEDDDMIRSGAESEPERGRSLKPLYRCNRMRLQTISRVVNEAAQLRGTLKLGNSRYRHRHWRGTAKECNERFLRKVTFTRILK